jgi:hypothetical protein
MQSFQRPSIAPRFEVRFAGGVRRWVVLLMVAGAFVPLSGCMSTRAWKYGAEPDATGPVAVMKSVAVPPFKDLRVNENSNLVLLYLIPLMPFGWMDLQTPESSQMHVGSGLWQWKPGEDMAKATAEEIKATRIFKEAFFTNRESEGDLVFQGTLQSTNYHGKIITYGLSVYGPLLWFIGFPACYTTNDLAVSFSLKDPRADKILWEKTYRRDTSKLSWIYYIRSDFDYAEFLKSVLLEAIGDLKSSPVIGQLVDAR